MKHTSEKAQQERRAENHLRVRRISEAGNKLGVQHTVEERRDGKHESDERAGSTDVKQSAGGANGRTQKDERSESSDERRKRNEKRIAGMNMMVATSEKMAQLVGEKNGEKSGGEGQTGEKRGRTLIEKSERAEEFVERDGLILRVGGGELRARGKASTKSQKKQDDGNDKRFAGWTKNRLRVREFAGWQRAPINSRWERVDRKF